MITSGLGGFVLGGGEVGSSRHRRTKQNAESVPLKVESSRRSARPEMGSPKVRVGRPRFANGFSPGDFRSATERAAQDQRSMYSTSSASRVMVASGSAASYLGTSEFVTSTARMPTLLAPWMSS